MKYKRVWSRMSVCLLYTCAIQPCPSDLGTEIVKDFFQERVKERNSER